MNRFHVRRVTRPHALYDRKYTLLCAKKLIRVVRGPYQFNLWIKDGAP